MVSFGINPQSSLMYPCSEELGQTLTVCHGAAVVVFKNKVESMQCFGVKYNQSEKSQKPYSSNIAQCLSASCHDAAVVLIKKTQKGVTQQ